MSISRTVYIDDILPFEMALLFSEYDAEEQAKFFHALEAITKKWPGAGWCQQSCSISTHLTTEAKEIIAKLAEWAADPYVPATGAA